jgi:hypothetical protein
MYRVRVETDLDLRNTVTVGDESIVVTLIEPLAIEVETEYA